MSSFIDGTDIGDAWVKAYEHLLVQPARGAVNFAVSISRPLEEDIGVRAALEHALANWNSTLTRRWLRAHSIHTVANTIFPISLYRPESQGAAARFFDRAARVSELHEGNRTEWGTYIGRLVSYGQPGEKRVNQLEQFLRVLGKGNDWKDAYEAPLTYAGEIAGMPAVTGDMLVIGPGDRRLRGGPCLAHISLSRVDGALHLTAQYRRHHYLARAYGNFLGLARLLHFLAREGGCRVGGMLVIGTHAEIEEGPPREQLDELLATATSERGVPRPIELSARPLGASWNDLDLPEPRTHAASPAMSALDATAASLRESSRAQASPRSRRAAGLLAEILAEYGTAGDRLRIGLDVCDVAWFQARLRSPSTARFLDNTFTADELVYCENRADRLAVRWAAKEAVAKAIGCGFRDGLRPAHIEIWRHAEGQPRVRSAKAVAWPRHAHTWTWLLSLSHDADLAAAVAIGLPPSPHLPETEHGQAPGYPS